MHKKRKKTPPATSESELFVEIKRAPDAIDVLLPSTSEAVHSTEEMPSTSTGRTVQVHLKPQFVSTNECREHAVSVQASLRSILTTECLMKMIGEGENSTDVKRLMRF